MSCWPASITGVRNLLGILGTDIFYRLGLLAAAAALPGETAYSTEIGLITALGAALAIGLPWPPGKSETAVSYWPGPGASGY